MRSFLSLTVLSLILLSSCAKKEPAAAPAASDAGGRHATVILRDGTKATGTVTASTATEVTLVGDDRITRTIPMDQVRSIEYGTETAAAPAPARPAPARAAAPAGRPAPAAAAPAAAPAPPPPPAVTTKTYTVPVGAQVSVRTNETIDSAKAAEGQTFAAQVTKDVQDADGDVVIPRGADARIVIRSVSKGGRIRGASDLVLDLQSVAIAGRQYAIETAEISQKGRSGIGANKRTAEYTGGGAALGAVIGAITGGGKGAAIGAGAGAGAGALTQIITKGGSIKVPVETVLTFKLDQPLRVTEAR